MMDDSKEVTIFMHSVLGPIFQTGQTIILSGSFLRFPLLVSLRGPTLSTYPMIPKAPSVLCRISRCEAISYLKNALLKDGEPRGDYAADTQPGTFTEFLANGSLLKLHPRDEYLLKARYTLDTWLEKEYIHRCETRAVKTIWRYWFRAVTDPNYMLCRRRLLREFHESLE